MAANKVETLYDADGISIFKSDSIVRMDFVGPFTLKHLKIARQFGVTEVYISTLSFGHRETLRFLLDLPELRGIKIGLFKPKDLRGLSRFSNLESIYLDLHLWLLGDRIKPVDFSQLNWLRRVGIMLCKPFESILTCGGVEELYVMNDCDRRLRDLDLTKMPHLRSLRLHHCPKLRQVELNPMSKIRHLEVSLCGGYQIDWDRFGPDLESLTIGGRLKFPLEDVLNAPNLKELALIQIATLPSLVFLRNHPKLRKVTHFSASKGVSGDNLAVVKEINDRANQTG